MNKKLLALPVIAALGFGVALLVSPRSEFVVVGALIDVGYRPQDHLASYDFAPGAHLHLGPDAVWHELLQQNELAAGVRRVFPRSRYHPVVAMVTCMDARARDPHLIEGITERERRIREFLARPAIAARIASGELAVHRAVIDTANERLTSAS